MRVWLLVMQGQGDTQVTVVDEETFAWVTSRDPGWPSGADGASHWEDQLVPAAQADKLRAAGHWPLEITAGSWENDRALAAIGVPEYQTFWSLGKALQAIQARGDVIADTWEGAIY